MYHLNSLDDNVLFYQTNTCLFVSVVHEDFNLIGCSDTEKEYMNGMDGEELWHADFIKGVGVITQPDFSDPITCTGAYQSAVANIEVCKANLAVAIKAYKNPQEKMGRICIWIIFIYVTTV